MEIESDPAIQRLIAFCKATAAYNDYRENSNMIARPTGPMYELDGRIYPVYSDTYILDNFTRIGIDISIDEGLINARFNIDTHGNQLSHYCKTIGEGGPFLLVPATGRWASDFDKSLQEHWGGASIRNCTVSREESNGDEVHTYFTIMENKITLKYNKCESLYISCIEDVLSNYIFDARIVMNGYKGIINV
ncbi:hypothetical protein EDD76_1128 [Kineothrix alysoides]|uniref:Uncharacterized protein n=1 Tax=Kineothrix alysoides TaxID=1469948 RepID=A0A4R1QT06_9FIRM|nr:hypothetical protein [Kineothrix alysoides]TCL56181.1 hypothetical protein EDD76_1128 [Kineothrix alysoides]